MRRADLCAPALLISHDGFNGDPIHGRTARYQILPLPRLRGTYSNTNGLFVLGGKSAARLCLLPFPKLVHLSVSSSDARKPHCLKVRVALYRQKSEMFVPLCHIPGHLINSLEFLQVYLIYQRAMNGKPPERLEDSRRAISVDPERFNKETIRLNQPY